MDGFAKVKAAQARAIKMQSAVGAGQATGTQSQNQTIHHAAELLGLPLDFDSYKPLQVLDAGDDFGKFYKMSGFSIEGGADVIGPL